MRAAAPSRHETPTSVSLRELIELKAAGDSIRLSAPRVSDYSGGNLSPFKGRGVEFDESRPYQEGDDLRTIDWRVTARTGKPHTKVFREERNRPVILWIDLERSMMFATRGAYKAVTAARAAGVIAWSAVANGDQLGGMVFSESGHEELRPRLGRRAALRLLQLVAANRAWQERRFEADPGATHHALDRLTRVVRPGSLVFLFSDFLAFGDDEARQIRRIASHCDVQLLHIYDPIEAELPPPGQYRIDTGSRIETIDTGDMALRQRYEAEFEARRQRLTQLARLPGVRLITCRTVDEPAGVLQQHFSRR